MDQNISKSLILIDRMELNTKILIAAFHTQTWKMIL